MPSKPTPFQPGLEKLRRPLLPLVRLLQLLFLTGPFSTVAELLAELPDEIETTGIMYNKPARLLTPYLQQLRHLEGMKTSFPAEWIIFDQSGDPLENHEAIQAWVLHHILVQELESINSLLCRPCDCTLCCIGPEPAMQQDFFEIPLEDDEISLFALPKWDTKESRVKSPQNQSPLVREGTPFFASPMALYHWRSGWSLILPRNSRCPHLNKNALSCAIYPQRPLVCRRPQIFSYLLERTPEHDPSEGRIAAYVLQGKILAIWDCPYVQRFKEEIAVYAEHCELEPIFKVNKS